ncbi:MAG TPA: PadR family transcriptional regulator [Actinomycetota bacterium]|jgi:DNA-binding PadR family transcriptional regulator|nr:PadR family transcriptional regulator [Actinomycetota bacterium]
MKQSGMLELPVLGLLKEREMHGYELRKRLTMMLGPFWQVSWGSLYPTLRRLARAGAVEKVQDASSRAGSLVSTRRRNVYRITDKGERLFARLLEETSGPIDVEHFTIRLPFFRYLDREVRVEILERRRAYLQERLAEFKESVRAAGKQDTYTESLQNHEVETTESDIAWIDELLTRERGSELGPRTKASKA